MVLQPPRTAVVDAGRFFAEHERKTLTTAKDERMTFRVPRPISPQVHRNFDLIALPATFGLAYRMRHRNTTLLPSCSSTH